ncbi:hypothetical protein GOV12_02450 [Candidatus Pacearchaeota archaeon]|nr:hypothetical protein [Candidatus Pacearchaeota archaeon]
MDDNELVIRLQQGTKLKGGENGHLQARVLKAVDEQGKPLSPHSVYDPARDLGAKVRLPGWTNIGDISAVLRTCVGLGEIYRGLDTRHIAVASKHTRPVVIAKGKTQLEAVVKAIAGDLNSPFGGVWGFNTPLTYEAARFLDKMFIEGTVAPEYENGVSKMLKDTSKIKNHANRFILQSGYPSKEDLHVFGCSLNPVVFGEFIQQDLEPIYDVRSEAAVVTGNRGISDINSLPDSIIDDINFAANAALYLSSNLVFFVHDGAIAGLGDGCGSRVVAAQKARSMLENSAYAAMSEDSAEKWDAVLYGTPFTRDDFSGLKMPIELTAFSDAFFPKLDGFVEASGIDRMKQAFGKREVRYKDGKRNETFIPKRNNYDPFYDQGLIPDVIVQPGGSMEDKVILPIAEEHGVKMVFTMDSDTFEKYEAGKKATGRRFFGHNVMGG